jgi:hypothetical protein
MRRATWQNGRRTMTGQWEYIWHADRFRIVLDQIDRVTGQNKVIVTAGSQREKPEWGNWALSEHQSLPLRGDTNG